MEANESCGSSLVWYNEIEDPSFEKLFFWTLSFLWLLISYVFLGSFYNKVYQYFGVASSMDHFARESGGIIALILWCVLIVVSVRVTWNTTKHVWRYFVRGVPVLIQEWNDGSVSIHPWPTHSQLLETVPFKILYQVGGIFSRGVGVWTSRAGGFRSRQNGPVGDWVPTRRFFSKSPTVEDKQGNMLHCSLRSSCGHKNNLEKLKQWIAYLEMFSSAFGSGEWMDGSTEMKSLFALSTLMYERYGEDRSWVRAGDDERPKNLLELLNILRTHRLDDQGALSRFCGLEKSK